MVSELEAKIAFSSPLLLSTFTMLSKISIAFLLFNVGHTLLAVTDELFFIVSVSSAKIALLWTVSRLTVE